MGDETQPAEAAFGQNLLEQMFELWIEPELARRGLDLNRGDIRKVVVELDPNAIGPIVKINEEAAVVAQVRATRAIAEGEEVTEADFDQVANLQPADLGANSGWICFAVVKGSPIVAFDFRYNRARAQRLIERARQFLASARRDAQLAPAVACDNAFSSAELAIQAQMLLQQQVTKQHWKRQEWIDQWTLHQNAPSTHSAALRELHSYRAAGRYADHELMLPAGRLGELLEVAQEMIDTAADTIGAQQDGKV